MKSYVYKKACPTKSPDEIYSTVTHDVVGVLNRLRLRKCVFFFVNISDRSVKFRPIQGMASYYGGRLTRQNLFYKLWICHAASCTCNVCRYLVSSYIGFDLSHYIKFLNESGDGSSRKLDQIQLIGYQILRGLKVMPTEIMSLCIQIIFTLFHCLLCIQAAGLFKYHVR